MTNSLTDGYVHVTATTAVALGSIGNMPETLHSKTLSPLKLEWHVTAELINNNQQIALLENQQRQLTSQLNSAILALNELDTTPVKDLDEEQLAARRTLCRNFIGELGQLKQQLDHVYKKMNYLYDCNLDLQEKYRRKMAHYSAVTAENAEEKVGIILNYLQTAGLDTSHPEITERLRLALKQPELLAAFLQEAKNPGQSGKGIKQKLKEWFQ